MPTHGDPLEGSGEWLAARLAAARPRLVRAARTQGIPADAAEDVAQETLLEAWRHRGALHAPDGLDAWLNAICRHVCHRYARAHSRTARHVQPLAPDLAGDSSPGADTDSALAAALADTLAVPDSDPAAALERRDLETLLDRALGHLAPATRAVVEHAYLDALPQREAAARLGLTISALEARLHRARRQLRAVLAGDLRAEAEDFGLTFAADDQPGWRESRIWCVVCARHRLRGAFQPLPGGGVNLHLVCPGCDYQVNSGGVVPLAGLTAFRPAYTRTLAYAARYITQGITRGWQACPLCGARRPVRLADARGGHDRPGAGYAWPGLTVLLECPTCDVVSNTLAAIVVWHHPAVQRFQAEHPRCVNEPETTVEYRGQPALRVRLTDLASAARLTIFAHRETLAVLAVLPG
jgi:RNA polymerase sigma-70 factor (ECF subfamily)